MQAFVSVENEAFKLRINTDNINIHNFRPRLRQISLTACQNSFAAFQLLFQCDCRTCINLDDSPWLSEYSESRYIYIRHEGELQPIMKHIGMRQGDDGFSYADVLESFPVADVPASYPASVFVSFEVPPDCPPGEYSGVFKIVSNYLFRKLQ